eukprot:CAMPEP_0184690476 /NCGR_PEP_ID=MMETSP0312-20130426/31250_1 /TAXON_ID=31354 /ORGANISM="Compsopogon coeruleus, Strain SAG 36.94" /LENGTH=194 /DNA_ID=CAMNT_0027147975 /DNA_START=316 /DNA_END=900 /DNA_ORIENTATION=+
MDFGNLDLTTLVPASPVEAMLLDYVKYLIRKTEKEKKYSCPVCDRKFSKSYNMRVHRRIHSDEKPVSCSVPGCGETFRWRSTLKSHVQAVHEAGDHQVGRRRKRDVEGGSSSTEKRLRTDQVSPAPSSHSGDQVWSEFTRSEGSIQIISSQDEGKELAYFSTEEQPDVWDPEPPMNQWVELEADLGDSLNCCDL